MTILKTLSCIFIFITLLSCNQQEPAPVISATDSTANKEFFPVYDFLRNEIRSVDSLPVGLKYFVVTNGKADSGYISVADFDRLAQLFTPEAIKPAAFKSGFRETSFYDRGTKTSTFMYQPVDSNSPVRRIDIITKPTDTYDRVSSIYLESYDAGQDSTVLNKLIWYSGRYMLLNQQVAMAGKPEIQRQTKVVWNNWDETK